MVVKLKNMQTKLQSSDSFFIRPASQGDLLAMVELSSQKRTAYEKAQPMFWRRAENADENQSHWFKKLLNHKDYILRVAELNGNLIGFIIGQLLNAPEVYDPGGRTLMIDDFCVQEEIWESVGEKLVQQVKEEAKSRGAIQILVTCGAHDAPKQAFLKKEGLSIASEWYVEKI